MVQEEQEKHVPKLIQRDIYHLLHITVNADADQPLVLMTAPTGTAAFLIGGSTIDSELLTYDSSTKKTKLGEENNHATQT